MSINFAKQKIPICPKKLYFSNTGSFDKYEQAKLWLFSKTPFH